METAKGPLSSNDLDNNDGDDNNSSNSVKLHCVMNRLGAGGKCGAPPHQKELP